MRTLIALASVVAASTVAGRAAVVNYSLSGTTDNGTLVSGSFSFDNTVIGANYNSSTALPDLITFTVTLSNIPATAGATTTTFTKTDISSIFQVTTDGTGAVVDFGPGFDGNADDYSLNPFDPNRSTLEHTVDGLPDTVTWTYSQVPEVGPMAVVTGIGLLAWVTARRRNA